MRNSIIGILLVLLTSCVTTRGIIPDAIANGEKIGVRVETMGANFTPFYDVIIQKTGEEYELIQTEGRVAITYKLPANKLQLLSEMEVSMKDLNKIGTTYFLITIQGETKQKEYKINTDIMRDLITGLKKK